jgi:hypothetical protein
MNAPPATYSSADPFNAEMTMNTGRWPALACLMLSTAHADDTHRHSATLTVQADENDNRQWLSRLALPVGDRAWVQGSLGRTELAATGASSTKIVGAAVGIVGQRVNAAVELVQRKAGARYEQQDWAAAFNWRGARGGLGTDVFLRSASGESRTTRSGGVFASPVTTTARESVDCAGFGLHGDFDLTPQAKVFAGAMRYRYDFGVDSAATGSSTPLSSLLGTDAVLSGAWRDQAFIDRSYRVGGSYRFQSAAVSAQYLRDRTANTGDILHSVQLQAEFPIAGHWLVSPMIGYSSGGSLGQASYGGLSLGFHW